MKIRNVLSSNIIPQAQETAIFGRTGRRYEGRKCKPVIFMFDVTAEGENNDRLL